MSLLKHWLPGEWYPHLPAECQNINPIIINHVIAETLTNGRMIPSSTSRVSKYINSIIIKHVIAETLTTRRMIPSSTSRVSKYQPSETHRCRSIEECPSNSPFLKNNGAEVPKVPRPIVFKEWRDTRTFSNLKSTHCTLLILLIINLVSKK